MILLHPYAQRLRTTNMPNAKTPPDDWWKLLLSQLSVDQPIVQIATATEPALVDDVRRDQSYASIADLLHQCDYFLTVDSFLPHLASHLTPLPRGVVIWSASDPTIFGYSHNLNLLRDRSYLRRDQFGVWEDVSYNPDAFMSVEAVLAAIAAWRAAEPHVLSCPPTVQVALNTPELAGVK